MKTENRRLALRAAALLLAATATALTYATNDVVTVGTPGSGRSLPIGATNKYVLTQQVYTASEINHAAGDIWSLGFNTVNGGVSRHLSIYATATDDSGVWQYTPPTDNDLMFCGDVYFAPGQWNTIDFDKALSYDGTSNLLITICDDTGTSGDYSTLSNRYYNPGSSHLIYATNDDAPYNPTDANESTDFTSISSWKAQIQLTFADLPTPSGLAATDITDESALIQCTLRGDAIAWNLRYRRVAGENEEEPGWEEENNLDTRSFPIEGLDAGEWYEAQVQAVFPAEAPNEEGETSDWTASLTFSTHICPPEDMCELLYSMNVYYTNGAAFRIVDDATGIEQAYVQFNTRGVTGGAIPLCAGRKYNVYWVRNNAYTYQTENCTFTLFFTPGDEFYTMGFNQAPAEDGLLTSFVMDCSDYCAPMPRFVTSSDVTYNSATLTYEATTAKEEVQYSTDPTFPEENTTTVEAVHRVANGSVTYNLTGLESLTSYYVRLRSVCDDSEGGGISRWTPAINVITTSAYALPLRVKTSPANSTTENLSWGRKGKEPLSNVNYRAKGSGTPATDALPIDIDGDGSTFEQTGDNTYESMNYYGGTDTPDNVLAVPNVPAGAMVSWLAAQGKSGANTVYFTAGFYKQAKKYADNEFDEAAVALKDAIEAESEQEAQEQADEHFVENTLEAARILEAQIAVKEATLGALDPSSEEYEELQDEIRMMQLQLEEIQGRLSATDATDAEKAAMAALAEANNSLPSNAPVMRRAPKSATEEYYTFFIRHTKPNDFLIVKDITITAPENIGDWTVISGVRDVKYALDNLQGGTEYEVMVQPVYDSGLIGAGGPITVFSTLGEDTDPLAGVFSISEEKKVSFAKGNLRYDGDAYEGTWSIAPQQYDVLGESNIEYSGSSYSYPATLHDMLCWSTASNSYGVSNYYYYDEEAALPYFLGDFADWGESPTLIADLGTGWTTLTVDEWNYLLNERDNAAQLRTIATVAGVKGLVLLPDQWEAPAGVLLSDDMSSGEWSADEQAGAVFLPAAGQLTTTYEDYRATTTLTEAATYWTATSSDDESGMKAMVLTIGDNEVTLTADLNRRVGTAVRLVKPASQAEPGLKGDLTGDGSVDGSDVSALLEMVLEGGLTDAQKAVADLTGDGDVDGSDISALLEIVLSGE